jgi:hypothetical protein
VRKLFVLIILGVGGYFLVQNVFFKADSAAVKTYKQFADAYVVRDFEKAALYAAGNAASHIWEQQSNTSMKFMGMQIDTPLASKGILERSIYSISSEERVGDTADIVASMRASISWGGATANPNSPGSYIGHAQTAKLENTTSGWKVVEFEDRITSEPR